MKNCKARRRRARVLTVADDEGLLAPASPVIFEPRRGKISLARVDFPAGLRYGPSATGYGNCGLGAVGSVSWNLSRFSTRSPLGASEMMSAWRAPHTM